MQRNKKINKYSLCSLKFKFHKLILILETRAPSLNPYRGDVWALHKLYSYSKQTVLSGEYNYSAVSYLMYLKKITQLSKCIKVIMISL